MGFPVIILHLDAPQTMPANAQIMMTAPMICPRLLSPFFSLDACKNTKYPSASAIKAFTKVIDTSLDIFLSYTRNSGFLSKKNHGTILAPCRGSSVVERCPEKAGVGSSILPLGTIIFFEPGVQAGASGFKALPRILAAILPAIKLSWLSDKGDVVSTRDTITSRDSFEKLIRLIVLLKSRHFLLYKDG